MGVVMWEGVFRGSEDVMGEEVVLWGRGCLGVLRVLWGIGRVLWGMECLGEEVVLCGMECYGGGSGVMWDGVFRGRKLCL